ncbi:MAG: hypothetical protein PHZ11_07975 [Desulfitobacteriaceae bacterium]|jgi:hypothetical protein|nr:hypothetical protein [Desulfitobacteriaceae bacterium]MDD4402033.1 hypothetical protein [Desulfitobacteriaceae bacterium]
MALISTAAVKKCVTCEFWNGARVASPTGREVKYKLRPTDGDTGICSNGSSIKKGKPVRGGDSGCTKWTKWSSLK